MCLNKYRFAVVTVALFSACALPVRNASLPAVPAGQTAPGKNGKLADLSPEDVKKVEGLYYRAVGAYSDNDMYATMKYLNDIFALYPSYPPAMELRGKVKSVSGSAR